MSTNTIEIFDIDDGKAGTYEFKDSDTFGDLRRTIAQKEGYESFDKLKILLTGFPLPDHLLVMDFIDTKLSVDFETYASITCTSDEEIYVWAGENKCIKLFAATEETFKLDGILQSYLAICRSK